MIYRMCAAALALAISATAASAAVTTYTDRALWEADLKTLGATRTDNAFGTDITASSEITFGSGVKSKNEGGDPCFACGDNSVDSGGTFKNVLGGDEFVPSPTNTWTFPSAIRGFGAVWLGAEPGSLQVTINDGDGDPTFLIGDIIGSGTGFLGFIGMGDFSSVVFSNADANGIAYDARNLSFATVVPLPAGLPLMAAALLALGLIGRRAKRAT